MLHDGMIGPKSVLIALSSLTTGNLNSKLKKEAKSYKMQDILPTSHEYIVPPQTDAEKEASVQNALMTYIQSKPFAPKRILNV